MRKYIASILLFLFLFSSLASAQEMTIIDKTTSLENLFYDSEQTGSITDRVNNLEQALYGTNSQDMLSTKLDKIYSYTTTNTNSPSLVTKLNATEWKLTNSVTGGSIQKRLGNLERIITGNTMNGSYDSQLNSLMNSAFSNSQITLSNQLIPKDTLVKIKITSDLDSRQAKIGDTVTFEAADDVYVNGMLAIGKGAQGIGKVTNVEHAKNFGRNAKIEISYDTIDAIDGNTIQVTLGNKAKEETKSFQTAAGASVAGMFVLGPVGIAGGAFIHGKEKVIPAGTLMYLQTSADTTIYALNIK